MLKDEIKICELMTGASRTIGTFQEYDKIYPFTSESLSSYITDAKDKNVLSVASSGDHMLELYYRNANEVDIFDINKLTKYYVDLKYNAIKYLEYDEFFSLFNNKNNNNSKELLDKLKPYLNKDAYDAFVYIIKYFSNSNGIIGTNLFFFNNKDIKSYYGNRCSYFDSNKYYELKNKIIDKSYKYINSDIYNLINKLNKEYDLIYLSNIEDYQKDKNKYINFLKELKEYLKEDGQLFFAYKYNTPQEIDFKHFNKLGKINKKYIESAFNKDEKDLVLSIKK